MSKFKPRKQSRHHQVRSDDGHKKPFHRDFSVLKRQQGIERPKHS